MKASFHDEFVRLFDAHYPHLFRYLTRLSGEADLAADLAQEAFVKLYQRGSSPDAPVAWLITVATNLFRNARTTRSRHARLLTAARAEDLISDSSGSPPPRTGDDASAMRVRRAIDRMPERERQMLLLRAEGYSYGEIAAALSIPASSIGTLLARAKRAFRDLYEETADAP